MTTPRVTVPVEPTEAMIKAGNRALSPWIAPAMHAAEAYRAMLSAAPAPEGGAVSIWSDARNVFVRYAELFAMTERYEEASAIADKAAHEIEALATREEAPAEAGENWPTLADLHTIKGWLYGLSTAPDLTDVVADGGVSVGDCYQQEAREFAGRIERIIAALRAQPPAREDARPVAGWFYEFHDFGDVWPRCVILNRPDGGANPPTKHFGSAIRNVRPMFYHPAPDALRVAVEALEYVKQETADFAEAWEIAEVCDEKIAALQAEQKGGA